MEQATQEVVDQLCKILPDLATDANAPHAKGTLQVFSLFADTVVKLSEVRLVSEFAPLLDYLEECMFHPVDEVKDAIATCFLEGLLAHSDQEPDHLRPLMGMLGRRCKAYIAAWNGAQGINRVPW